MDAFSGETLLSENLWASYSRRGRVRGLIRPRHWNNRRVEKDFQDLKVRVKTLSGSTVGSDQTDAVGRYDLSWNSTGHHLLGAELQGTYVQSVNDDDNSDLDHWITISVPPSNGTYDWTWSNQTIYDDQLNIFYHSNLMARWFENFYNVNHKVRLDANKRTSGDYARCYGGSVPRIVFSDEYDSERQAGIVYHEYTHSVSYAMHGSFIGTSGEGEALEESMADYFAQTFLGDKYIDIPNSNQYITLEHSLNYGGYDTLSTAERGLIGAGAAWRLRNDIGYQDTDEIIFAAFEMDPRPTTFEKYFDNTLLADDDINGNGNWSWESCDHGWGDTSPNAGSIWEAFNDYHGIPSSMLDEDPDCSPKIVADGTPVESTLEGAYPNPFNPSVNLRYRVDEPGQVEIEVYSITGQLIRHLSSDKVAVPGNYSVTWDGIQNDGIGASSGTYFIRVSQSDRTKSFKVTFLK